ncbi:MAG: ribonuclease HII [Candidatus Pacebacteria bacterium]|nr:ribonuclease HII [Candidatus Paceibacterota bacterium]
MQIKYIIGIDEVGRGPIAGPVCVASFTMRHNYELPINNYELKLPKLKDSKKLSKKQRELWFNFLKKQKEEGNCDFAVSFVSSQMIDKYGINPSIQKAIDKSLSKITSPEILFEKSSPTRPKVRSGGDEGGKGARLSQKELPASFSSYQIFLDGGLKAPAEYINQETIIKGDELHPVISMASIIAKVSRDKVMLNYSKEYINYGFENHSGYGTKAHYEAIKKHGQTPIHRKSFIH